MCFRVCQAGTEDDNDVTDHHDGTDSPQNARNLSRAQGEQPWAGGGEDFEFYFRIYIHIYIYIYIVNSSAEFFLINEQVLFSESRDLRNARLGLRSIASSIPNACF